MVARNYCFTINNYTEQERDQIYGGRIWEDIDGDVRYYVVGMEVGESGTPHLQGYVELENKKGLKWLKSHISARAHWEVRWATQRQAIDYCKKDGMWKEYGSPKEPGSRTDLKRIQAYIAGGGDPEDLYAEEPELLYQYGRTIDRLRDSYLRTLFRTEMTKCIWYWGATGTGKSHVAFKGYTPKTHYLWNCADGGWQDKYSQQETVIINDFRGEIPYNQFLQLVDKWPYDVKRRGREPMPFTSKLVIITSSLSPEQIYRNRMEEDALEQLLRRVEVVNLDAERPEVPRGNTGL